MTYSQVPTAEKVMKAMFEAGEETLIEVTPGNPQTTYVCNAPEGTALSAASWKVVRILEVPGNPAKTRINFREGMAYDNRADPTADGLSAWPSIQ